MAARLVLVGLNNVCRGVHRVTDLEKFQFESPRMKLTVLLQS